MNTYVICTDSGCDLGKRRLQEWGVPCGMLSFRFDGELEEYTDDQMEPAVFYQKMREGGMAKTSAVNTGSFLVLFESVLKKGKDVLYLGFSSGLSATYRAAELAADALRTQYPERQLVTVDTRAASLGQGLLVYLALQQQRLGRSMEAVKAYVEDIKNRLCHWVTVDTLTYLKRGGRINPALALIGNVLGLKPIICADKEGKLQSRGKVRGRQRSIAALAEKYGEYAAEKKGIAFISHAGCREDAENLAGRLTAGYGARVELIGDIGPVIGTHGGPGALALFFVGKEKL